MPKRAASFTRRREPQPAATPSNKASVSQADNTTSLLREFGYMRCVGASPGDIFKIVLTETVTLCLLGGVLGVIVGALGSSLADQLIRQVLPYVPAGKMVVFDASMLVLTLAVTVGMGALAGLYPSWKASHASPMEAIRNE